MLQRDLFTVCRRPSETEENDVFKPPQADVYTEGIVRKESDGLLPDIFGFRINLGFTVNVNYEFLKDWSVFINTKTLNIKLKGSLSNETGMTCKRNLNMGIIKKRLDRRTVRTTKGIYRLVGSISHIHDLFEGRGDFTSSMSNCLTYKFTEAALMMGGNFPSKWKECIGKRMRNM